jgi:cysteine-rich repeat protein
VLVLVSAGALTAGCNAILGADQDFVLGTTSTTATGTAGAGVGGSGGGAGGNEVGGHSGDAPGGGQGGTAGPGGTGGQGGAAGLGGTGGQGGSPSCGDGSVNQPSEQCDDGNTTPGDRCGATCLHESPDDCPGTPIALGTTPLVIEDTTAGASDTTQYSSGGSATCLAGDFPGADLGYAVTPTEDGQLVATLQAAYPTHYLAARSECTGTPANIGCDAHASAATPDVLSFAVTAGTVYYVRVDSYQSGAGAFTLTLELD